MSAPSEQDNAWGERLPLAGVVDFTIMYVAHDAFARDLHRLVTASRGPGWTPAATTGWETFTRQLHVHHQAEDEALWPHLRAVVSRPEEIAVLDAMEAEHSLLDPGLAAIDAAITARDESDLAEAVQRVDAGLRGHMRHEENAALPLIEAYLGPDGWTAFATHARRTQGLRGAAEFFPWLLDDVPAPTRTRVLGLLPPPLRLIYRRVWEPRYRRRPRWR